MNKLIKAIIEAGCYRIGPITPSVNIQLAVYPELRNLFSDPKHLDLVATELARRLPKTVELIAGAETSGIPPAVALSAKRGCRSSTFGRRRKATGQVERFLVVTELAKKSL